MDRPRGEDPTRVTGQPALTTSRGRSWLVVGALLSAVAVGVLIALAGVQQTIAITGAALVLALYTAMVVVRFVVRPARRRLLWMASLFGAIAVVGLASVVMIGAGASLSAAKP